MGSGYFGGIWPGAYSNGGNAPAEPDASEPEYFGKYKPEWAGALETVRTAFAEGFASEHRGASSDLRDAGR